MIHLESFIATKHLFGINHNKFKYIFIAYLTSFLPSIVISLLINPFIGDSGPKFSGTSFHMLFSLIIFAPLAETLLMWLIIYLLSFTKLKTSGIVLISATIWAILHSLSSPMWGLVVLWPFTVFSISFMNWKKVSITHAICITTAIHALQKFYPSSINSFLKA